MLRANWATWLSLMTFATILIAALSGSVVKLSLWRRCLVSLLSAAVIIAIVAVTDFA